MKTQQRTVSPHHSFKALCNEEFTLDRIEFNRKSERKASNKPFVQCCVAQNNPHTKKILNSSCLFNIKCPIL